VAFERFIPPQAAGTKPKATIRPSGLISFDANAVEAFRLRSAKYAVLFFDKIRKIVGIQISDNADEEGALPISFRRRSASLKAPHFFDRYALSFTESQRFDIGYDDTNSMLTINMKAVRRRRGRRPKQQL
jgi:hypothetical protein